MDVTAVQLAIYDWAGADFRREVRAAFPFVARVKGALGQRFVRHYSGLPAGDALDLGEAMLRKFHPQAAALRGDLLQPRHDARLSDLRQALRQPLVGEGPCSPGGGPGGSSPKLDRRRLETVLDRRLTEFLGGPRTRLGGGSWYYTRTLGSWQVRTFVDLGGRSHQLTYHHRLDGHGLAEAGGWLSLFSWLGIAGQTAWDLAQGGDEDEMVETTVSLVAHFIDAASCFLPV